MNIIKDGFDFGNDKSDKSVFSTIIRSLSLLIPGMILGHFVDKYINKKSSTKDDDEIIE
jgi:hypothetical protein